MAFKILVPARSGSKRLPNKNIKELAGKPLVCWTLEACASCPEVDEVIFSTDSQEYWEVAQTIEGREKLKLDLRSAEDAGDQVKIFDYIKANASNLFNKDDVFGLALPTVPLRTNKHIGEAFTQFTNEHKAVFSACEYGFPISFAFQIEGEEAWAPSFSDSPMLTGNTRSQNQKASYHPNGAIYIRAANDLIDNEEIKTLYMNAFPYIMSRESSVDIDNEIDFIVAESILNASLKV